MSDDQSYVMELVFRSVVLVIREVHHRSQSGSRVSVALVRIRLRAGACYFVLYKFTEHPQGHHKLIEISLYQNLIHALLASADFIIMPFLRRNLSHEPLT